MVAVDVARGSHPRVSDVKIAVKAETVVIHTGPFPDPTVFNEDFASLLPELVTTLYDRGYGSSGSIPPASTASIPPTCRRIKLS